MAMTREAMLALWDLQQQREAEARAQLRQTIAVSDVPLPEELANAVISCFITEMHDIMRSHPGHALAERRDSYRTSLTIMEQCFDDLLLAIDRFEEFALSDAWYAPHHRKKAAEFELIVQKELFATANSAVSLVDHARRMIKQHPLSDYNAKRLEAFGSDGLHEFVTGLRVLLHHLHVVDAGWSIRGASKSNPSSATFMLDKSALQVLAETHRGGLGAQYEPMKAYVDKQKKKIDVRNVLLDYRARVAIFHAWMMNELTSDALVALRDYDALHKRKRHRDSRMNWNALLRNWLNWSAPPDPHSHLHRFLTPEEIADVYSLPRNSEEQIDRIIQYGDREGAVDDNIRALIHELFRRSPPT